VKGVKLLENLYKGYYETPIGWMEVVSFKKGILSVGFIDEEEYKKVEAKEVNDKQEGVTEAKKCIEQLDEYFNGKRKVFDVILDLRGTVFQKKVWQALRDIAYGETASYGAIAKAINNKKASRAVGNANNKNPVSIIVPCHRVIGSDGSLTGYGGGLFVIFAIAKNIPIKIPNIAATTVNCTDIFHPSTRYIKRSSFINVK
jgi:methylated-DNA-[protein]-cysteine S-methyltransferase